MEDSLQTRRDKAARAWNLGNEVVLIAAGEPIGIPGGADQCFPYHPHPDYRWLTNRSREGGVLAFDPSDGWTLFEPPVSEQERVWGGGPPAVGRPIEELADWLHARSGREIARLGVGLGDDDLSRALQSQLLHVRRAKDEAELVLIKRAIHATAAGHAVAREMIRPGVSERQIQIAMEAAMMEAGADCTGYASIVGTGSNSAIFHFTPSGRTVSDGDFVLIDAGAEVDGYVADVTRTYPGNIHFSPEMQEIYDAVKAALNRAVDQCRVGSEWLFVHETAARSLAESLRDLHFIHCDPDEALESELNAMLLPHRIGHMVRLGVRDASGGLPGRDRPNKVAGIKIRMDLPLEANYLVTVEPGLYFSEAILSSEDRRQQFSSQVNWAKVDQWIGRGGVRLEDNILVTPTGPLNLTAEIPM